ncbi:MAG: Ig-like domain-containing protein, partial [Bacteroidales bacterium]|nr:Ig-like domain-containing protein [Bacteroidales bacterium]
MRKTILLFLAMFALFTQAQQTKRIYLIGNSVTDAVNFDGFKALAESAGNEHIWARHVILGSPLNLLWQNFDGGPNKDQGYATAPFGYPKEAFAAYAWDAVTLQPFDRSIEGDEGDKRMIKNYINELVKKSPEAKVCIYSRWPRKNNIENQSDIPPAQDYNDLWDGTYNKNGKSGLENERRKYFHDLTDAVVADNYGVNVVMIPVGEVFYELNKRMMQGQFPGCDNIWKVYSDGIHLNTLGNYIVSTTFFTTIYEQDPVGLSVPGNFAGVTAAQAQIVQEVAKQVVLAEKKYTKIEYFGAAPVKSVKLTMAALELNVGKKAVLIPVIAPANAANKKVTWGSNSANVSVDENGVVTAKAEGTAEITVTTEDGAFTDKCLVTVVNTGTPVNALSISSKEESVYKGETKQLSVTIDPAGATNKNVIWTSSDENIATVSQAGLVTAVKKGTTSIVALSENGALADTCEVKVIVHNNPPNVDLRVNATAGYAPFKVYFDGSKSTDPDPDDFVLGYNWKIEELGIEEKSNGFEYTFTQPGTYTVTLSTVDSNGATSLTTESVTITVLDIPAVDPDEPALCYDGFDYVAGPLHSLNGGRGWNGAWNVQNGNMEMAGFEVRDALPLKYKNLKSAGNYMIGGRAYLQTARGLNTSSTGEFKDYINEGKIGKNGTTLWLSTLIRKEKNNNDGVQLSLFNGHPGGAAAGKVHFGYFGTSGDRKWEMKVDETVYSSEKPLVIGETALIIAKIEFGTTNKISLYVNPAGFDGNEPAEADVEATTSSDIAFSTVGLTPTSGPDGACFDEIRFGKTYADVTPYKILQKYTLTVQDGTVQGGNSQIEEESVVTIVANLDGNGKRFTGWTSEDNIEFADPAAATTTFTMPAANVTVKANYIDVYNVSVESGTADK